MTSTLFKTIALSSLLTCSAAALAAQSDYKLMVIEDAASAPLALEQSFNRCALNVKSKNYAEAEAICSKAIALLKQSTGPRVKVRELTAYALSNRGVGRLMSQNDAAALSDFYEAKQMLGNALVSHNLNRAKEDLSL
ncbi:hypothetical protein [Pseudoalteromonas mariniglutinosa]|uniref:hypothetical protein n=1 Tax=Pseudoalteromonas mariniglutinosa TaxID=206042 RepID=UPI0038517EC2